MNDIENNKQLARHWFKLIGEHKIEELCAITAPAWIMRGGPPNLPAGHTGVRELFRHIGQVEQTWTIEDVIAEHDKVVVRATNSCVQESFFGIDGRGKRQIFSAIFILRIVDRLVLETWRNADDLGRLFQLGAQIVPGTAEA